MSVDRLFTLTVERQELLQSYRAVGDSQVWRGKPVSQLQEKLRLEHCEFDISLSNEGTNRF